MTFKTPERHNIGWQTLLLDTWILLLKTIQSYNLLESRAELCASVCQTIIFLWYTCSLEQITSTDRKGDCVQIDFHSFLHTRRRRPFLPIESYPTVSSTVCVILNALQRMLWNLGGTTRKGKPSKIEEDGLRDWDIRVHDTCQGISDWSILATAYTVLYYTSQKRHCY